MKRVNFEVETWEDQQCKKGALTQSVVNILRQLKRVPLNEVHSNIDVAIEALLGDSEFTTKDDKEVN